jgi:serine protease Do
MHRRAIQIGLWFTAATLGVVTVVTGLGLYLQDTVGTRPTLTLPVQPNQEVGIVVQDITPAIASSFGLKEDRGAVVTALDIGTLQAGDVILSVNGQNVSSRRGLEMALAQIPPADTLIFHISRNGGMRDVVIQRAANENARSEDQSIPTALAPGFRGVRIEGFRGVRVQDVSGGLTQGSGVTVTTVDRGTPADAAGLKAGDIIMQVNDLPVQNVEEFFSRVERLSGQLVNLGVIRQGIFSIVIVPSYYY